MFEPRTITRSDPAATEIGNRAIRCPGWVWLPGMATLRRLGRVFGPRGVFVATEKTDGDGESWADFGEIDATSIPDVSDPATIGALYGLVRRVYADPGVYCRPVAGGWVCVVGDELARRAFGGGGGSRFYSETEPGALVDALEWRITINGRAFPMGSP